MNNSTKDSILDLTVSLGSDPPQGCCLGALRLKETQLPKKDTKSASAKGEVVNGEEKNAYYLRSSCSIGQCFQKQLFC